MDCFCEHTFHKIFKERDGFDRFGHKETIQLIWAESDGTCRPTDSQMKTRQGFTIWQYDAIKDWDYYNSQMDYITHSLSFTLGYKTPLNPNQRQKMYSNTGIDVLFEWITYVYNIWVQK